MFHRNATKKKLLKIVGSLGSAKINLEEIVAKKKKMFTKRFFFLVCDDLPN